MATKTTEKPVTEEKKEEVKFNPADYWCEIVLEKTPWLFLKRVLSFPFRWREAVWGARHLVCGRIQKNRRQFGCNWGRRGNASALGVEGAR